MRFKPGEHICVTGVTGSGKTFGVKNAWLPPFPRVIVVDTEGFDFEDFPKVDVRHALKLADSEYRFHVRILLSGHADQDWASVDSLCYGLLDKGHDLAVYFDEVTDYSTATSIPDSMRALIRKSRKRGISVIVGTQRPQFLNKAFLSNSVHRIYYYMSDYDSEHIKDYAPFLKERMAEIPYQSWRSLYEAPDGSVTVIGPATPYNWRNRDKK